MQTSHFQIARWALFASFALMVLVVCLPNPHPSTSWEIAQQDRYEQRFPQLKPSAQPVPKPNIQFAEGKPREDVPETKMAKEPPAHPLRTAHLPERSNIGDQRPGTVQMGQPLFFPEDEPPAKNLAPDPVHLEPPQLREP